MKMKTKDFAEYLDGQLDANRELAEEVDNEELNSEIACLIVEVREAANLSQKQLAKLVGTQQSVISRLEDAGYEGHSLSMLRRIASALGKRVHIEFRNRVEHSCSENVIVNLDYERSAKFVREYPYELGTYGLESGIDRDQFGYSVTQEEFYGQIYQNRPQPISA